MVFVKRFLVSLGLIAVPLLAAAGLSPVSLAQPAQPEVTSQGARSAAGLASAPIQFVQNVGQFDPSVRFQVQTGGGTLWLTDHGLWLVVLKHNGGPAPEGTSMWSSDSGLQPSHGVALELSFVGANPHPRLEPLDRLNIHTSYFTGNDPAAWHASVPVWGGVRYVDLYPGVDLLFTGKGGVWEQRLSLQPGVGAGTLKAVRLHIEGADRISLDGSQVSLATAAGQIAWPLFAIDGTAKGVHAAPRILDHDVLQPFNPADVSFSLFPRSTAANVQATNSSQLLYATYLGGSGDDSAWGMAMDSSGAVYLSGITSSADFPTTPGAFQTITRGTDAFITKINPSGTAIDYSTFLGGSGTEGARAIVVDASGDAFVTGYTSSTDFPTTPGALQRIKAGQDDAFVTKLNPTGSALIYSTLLGKAGDEGGRDIVVSADGVATIVGLTSSPRFPVTRGALQRRYGGLTDGFIVKLNATGSGLVYSTFLGGTGYDEARAVQRDAQGNLYVTGRTQSVNFPTTPGAYQTVAGGDSDAFVLKLNPAGNALVYSTYLGATGYDYARGIAVDGAGSAYVTGATLSSDFPTTPGAYQTTYGTHQDAFVTKLNPSGTGLVYSTFLGGAGGDAGRGVVVDSAGTAYLSGWTTSRNFPTTANAYQRISGGLGDWFVTALNPAGSGLDYSTYFGGTGDDGAYGGILWHATGIIIASGYTGSPNMPTTAEAFQGIYGGGADDAFLVRLATGP